MGHVRGPVLRLRVALLRPANRRVSALRDSPAIVDWILLPAARRVHVHALGEVRLGFF